MAAVLLLVPVLVAMAVAAGQPSTHLAKTSVVYTGANENLSANLNNRIATQVQVLQSRTVLDPVARANGVDVADLEQRVTAERVKDSQVVEIEVTETDAGRAQAIAQSIQDTYLKLPSGSRSTTKQELLQRQIAGLNRQLDTVRNQIATQARWSTRRTDRQLSVLQGRETVLNQALADLQNQLTTERLSQVDQATAARAGDRAYVVAGSSVPKLLPAAAAGLLVGLLLAIAYLAYVRSRMRRSS